MFSFAKEAWPFVLPFIVVGGLLLLTDWRKAAVVLIVLGLLILLFFRIPPRPIGGNDPVLLAAACGKITAIEETDEPLVGAGPHIRIVTFLSVFDVHVQRAPAAGKVIASEFRPGRKVAAFRADAGEVNEGRLTVLELADSGDHIGIRQIAGLIARRVVGYLGDGDQVERGQLMGVIRFGSRVDLIVPASYEVLVEPGQRVVEGLTPIARPGSGG